MKLPEKIYLNAPKLYVEECDVNSVLDVATWDTKEYNDCVNFPYVNKETLIEWAEGEIERLDQYDRYESGLISGLKKLVEHLKSM
jgi:hypothetical protein